MDAVFMVFVLALWLAMVMMVWGLTHLEKPKGERP
jgi:hypothetical protein